MAVLWRVCDDHRWERRGPRTAPPVTHPSVSGRAPRPRWRRYPPPVSAYPASTGVHTRSGRPPASVGPPPVAPDPVPGARMSATSPSPVGSSGSCPAPPRLGLPRELPAARNPSSSTGLLLLESDGDDPVDIDSLTFTDDGIGVTRTRGEQDRVLPWTSVTAHVIEAWRGGVVPEWWVDPELNRRSVSDGPSGSVIDPGATNRALPHAEAGALIGIKTHFGTYRFLLPGEMPELARQVAAFAVRNQGPTGASSVTRVVAWGLDAERAQGEAAAEADGHLGERSAVSGGRPDRAHRHRGDPDPLQSAGTIHLPFLGGPGPATVGLLRTR